MGTFLVDYNESWPVLSPFVQQPLAPCIQRCHLISPSLLAGVGIFLIRQWWGAIHVGQRDDKKRQLRAGPEILKVRLHLDALFIAKEIPIIQQTRAGPLG